ncbi:MAG: SoxR reducing system RseC family protein [Bacteroidales bacterium]|nr:SoxR reducing system RseC family protein [Bacteroidales bacterium]
MDISHSGKITEITPQFITVEIISSSACSSCHAASVCSLSESKVKTVQVPFDFRDWSVGEEVEVCLKKTMGYKAVWISYVVPLLVLFAVLMGATKAGAGELFSGLSAIAAVALYYLVIYLLRNRLRNEYTFYINKK